MQEIPVVLQFHPVDLRPRLDEPLLCLWQASSQALNRVDSEDGRVVLVVGVEMRSMVRRQLRRNIRITIPKNRDSSGTHLRYIVGFVLAG